jgi:hypothetical protein
MFGNPNRRALPWAGLGCPDGAQGRGRSGIMQRGRSVWNLSPRPGLRQSGGDVMRGEATTALRLGCVRVSNPGLASFLGQPWARSLNAVGVGRQQGEPGSLHGSTSFAWNRQFIDSQMVERRSETPTPDAGEDLRLQAYVLHYPSSHSSAPSAEPTALFRLTPARTPCAGDRRPKGDRPSGPSIRRGSSRRSFRWAWGTAGRTRCFPPCPPRPG